MQAHFFQPQAILFQMVNDDILVIFPHAGISGSPRGTTASHWPASQPRKICEPAGLLRDPYLKNQGRDQQKKMPKVDFCPPHTQAHTPFLCSVPGQKHL